MLVVLGAVVAACNVYTPELVATTTGADSGGSGGRQTGGSTSGGLATGGSPLGGAASGGAPGGGVAGSGAAGGEGAVATSGGAPSGGRAAGGAPPAGGGGVPPEGGARSGGAGGVASGGGPLGGVPPGGAGGTPPDGGNAGTMLGGAPPVGGGGAFGGAAGDGGASGSLSSGGTGGVPVDPNLIDDFERNNSGIEAIAGRAGFWYTYSDESAGVITPVVGSTVRPQPLPDGPRGSSENGMHVTCTEPFTTWGAGFGFDLSSGDPYDVSPYTGIRFFVRSGIDFTGTHPDVAFRVKTTDVVLSSAGGTCPPAGYEDSDCDNTHQILIAVTADWTEVRIGFSDLAQDPAWGYLVDFNPAHALAVQFQVSADETFDVWLDDISFYTD